MSSAAPVLEKWATNFDWLSWKQPIVVDKSLVISDRAASTSVDDKVSMVSLSPSASSSTPVEAQAFCKVCNVLLGVFSNGSTRGKKTTLVRHEQSDAHRALSGSGTLRDNAAPSVEEFLKCLERRAKQESLRKSPVGCIKEWRLTWCLSEANKDQLVKLLANAQSTTVSQDAQGQLLSVRFLSALDSKSGEAFVSGLAGLVNDWGAGSVDLSMAVRKATQRLFISRWKPPRGWQGQRPLLKKKPLEKFCLAVHFVASDAAADETKAIRILAGRDHACAAPATAIFPNVRSRVRDSVHAAARFTPKWKVVPFLQDTFQKYVRSNQSVTSVIWHSKDNKRLFNFHVLRFCFNGKFFSRLGLSHHQSKYILLLLFKLLFSHYYYYYYY